MKRIKFLAIISGIFLLFSVMSCSKKNETKQAKATENGTKKGYVIGFSNNFNGNTWRHDMEELFKKQADQMIADGVLASYKILEANKSTPTQISQIQSLILDGVDGIIIDPASSTALNGVIEKATEAGIPVLVIDNGPVTSDKCYQLNWDIANGWARPATNYLVDRLNGKGNIIEIRGLPGTSLDDVFHKAVQEVITANPGMKIVGEVYGEWTATVAQKQVASIISGIDHVDGVVGQGGDAYGAVQAFKAAGKDIPIVVGGNRGNFLNWWLAEKNKNGYETFSVCSNPGCAAAALYIITDILDGVSVPKDMIMPTLEVTQDTIDSFKGIAEDDVASTVYDHEWVKKNCYVQN